MASVLEQAVDDATSTDLVELSVVLVATSNNPSIINPDFLITNGIVEASWPIQENPVTTPVFAQIVYKNGLVVRADPERVVFAQSAPATSLSNIICPRMAEQYARIVPHVPYRAVGINPKLYFRLAGTEHKPVASAIDDQGKWLSFKDSEPEIQLKLIYAYNERKINLDIIYETRHNPDGNVSPALLFQGNVHHDLGQTSSQNRIETLTSTIRSWECDVLDCRTLAAKFISRNLRG